MLLLCINACVIKTLKLHHQLGSNLVGKYFMGHTRLSPNLVNFEGKLEHLHRNLLPAVAYEINIMSRFLLHKFSSNQN